MRLVVYLLCLWAIVFCCPAVWADETVGSIKTVEGQAFIERGGRMLPARGGDHLQDRDALVTGADGALGIIFRDDSTMSLGPDSRIELREFAFDPAGGRMSFVTRMTKGTASFLSGLIGKLAPEKFRVETPLATVSIRGTRFLVRVAE